MTDAGALAVASSDGRTFTLEPAAVVPGDLIVVPQQTGTVALGQVMDQTGGVLLGTLSDQGFARAELGPFPVSEGTAADVDALAAVQESTGAEVTIGTWRSGEVDAPARLRAQGFNRHTFLCGQSGSGKTYALGVLLEQMLLATELRMVILDPNADFVRLGEARPGVTPDAADQVAALDVRVLGASPPAEPLRLRFATMPRLAQAAVLRLDPLADRDEYNLFLHALASTDAPPREVSVLVDELRAGRCRRAGAGTADREPGAGGVGGLGR